MSGRTKEETAGITHLGSQGTKYDFNYCPEVLKHSLINIRIMIIL